MFLLPITLQESQENKKRRFFDNLPQYCSFSAPYFQTNTSAFMELAFYNCVDLFEVWGRSNRKLDSINHLKFTSNNLIVFPKTFWLRWVIWHPVEEVRTHRPYPVHDHSSIWNGLDLYVPLMTSDIWRPADSFSALAHCLTFRPLKLRRIKGVMVLTVL